MEVGEQVGEIEVRLHAIEVDPRVGTCVTLAVVRDGELLGTHGAVVDPIRLAAFTDIGRSDYLNAATRALADIVVDLVIDGAWAPVDARGPRHRVLRGNQIEDHLAFEAFASRYQPGDVITTVDLDSPAVVRLTARRAAASG